MRAGAGVLFAGLLAVAVAGCGAPPAPVVPTPAAATSSRSAGSYLSISVDRRPLIVPAGSTLAQAMAIGGVTVSSGHVLSARSHRRLAGRGQPAQTLLNGWEAPPGSLIHTGDSVAVRAGADRVEATETVVLRVRRSARSQLYVGGRDGRVEMLRGVLSGEEVSERVLRRPTQGHLTAPGAVALTFDDGPDPTWTPRVLAVLAEHGVHATFCMIGQQAAAHPDLVRAVVAAGHTLCDHTWDHDEHLPTRSGARVHDEIADAAAAIRAASGGVPAGFFRAPGGVWSAQVEAEARRQHLTPLIWTVDPRDWARPGVPAILATVSRQVRPGGIILMHDGGGNRAQTVAALGELISTLAAQGYSFVVPPTAGDRGADDPEPGAGSTP